MSVVHQAKRTLRGLLLLLAVGTAARAQSPRFEHFSEKEGLAHSNITSILKDRYGFLWFGTFNGLSRYDGYRFYNYTNRPDDSASIPGSQVRCLYETKNGTLLVGFLFNGFCIYDRKTDAFKRYKHDPAKANSLMHDYVLTFYEDRKGNLWIGTRTGLDKFDPETETFTHFYPFSDHDKSFVSSIVEDRNGNLWLYGLGPEVCRFNPSKNTYEYKTFVENDDLSSLFNRGGMLKWDRRGNLWIGNEVAGIFIIDTATWTSERLNTQNGQLASNAVTCIMEDSQGILWIGTDGGGIYRYNERRQQLSHWEHTESDPASLASNAVYTIMEGDPGIVWIGMYASGVNKWVKSKQRFMGYTANGQPGKCLSQKSVLAIAAADNGKIWLGTDGGGLNLFDPETQTFKYYTTGNSQIGFDVVKSILVDRNGDLWLGSYSKGLCQWNPEKGLLRHYRADVAGSSGSILRNDVWALMESSNQDLYIGLLSGGFDVRKHTSGLFTHNPIDTVVFTNLANSNVFAFAEDRKKRIWIATENMGVVCFDPASDKTIRFTTQNSDRHSLISNDIRDVFADSQGNIWLATFHGGLIQLTDFEKKAFRSYATEQGLNTRNVLSVLEDDHDRLWLSTDKGISVFHPEQQTFENYDTEDGLICTGYNYNSKLKAKNGYLYFGGVTGFSYFHPDSLLPNTRKPPVVITELDILNKPVRPNTWIDGRKILNTSIFLTKEIKLEYKDNIIRLEFAALDYTAPDKNQYAYKLKGFDSDWRYTSKRTATYTNLNPGAYTFLVKASNNDGVWNDTPKALTIVITPPWWMTWWFRGAVILGLIAAVSGYYYQKVSQIKKQNTFLEEEVKKRTADLKKEQETKDKFYSIIAHDLKNPVAALKVLTEMLNTESKSFTNPGQQELIKNIDLSTNQLYNLVINLLRWTKTQTSHIMVEKVKFDVYDILRENMEIYKPSAALKNIRLTSKMAKGYMVTADKAMISTVLRNLIGNAIKFTPKGGELFLEIYSDRPGSITIMIQDNGMGMEKETLGKLFRDNLVFSVPGTENEKGTGLGIMICKEFLHLNEGTLEVESHPGQGTTCYIHIPGTVEQVSEPDEQTEFSSLDTSREHLEQLTQKFLAKHILIVEDDPQMRSSLESLLSRYFTVHVAAQAKDAFLSIKENLPDLILSDIHMPDENGLEFCKTIKKNRDTSHIPLILMTAEDSVHIAQDALNAGADSFIIKPFDKMLLLTSIYNLITTLENAKFRFSHDPSVRPSELTKNKADEELIEKAILFIEKHLDNEKLNGDMLARELGTSKSYLYVKLKTLTGMTLNEFVKSIRLKRSTQLLLSGEMTIAQVSYALGFSEPSYFTKVFTKYFGMNPKEYISRNKS